MFIRLAERLFPQDQVDEGLARLAATEDLRAAGLADRDDPEFARTAEVERALDAFLRQGDLERPDATRAALHGLAALM